MKKGLAILAALAAAWAAGGASGANVRIVRAEGVPEGMAASVASAIEHGANVPAEIVRGGTRAEGESAEDFARREGAREDGVSLVLVDWDDEPTGGLARPEEGFAFLNLARLADGPVPGDVLAGRADREALRAHAHLMGIPPCPFPLCVLTQCGSVEALDSMSGSYCPPCWETIRKVEAEKGFELLPFGRKEQGEK